MLDFTGPRCDDDIDAPMNKCSSCTSIYCNNAYSMKHDNMNDDVVYVCNDDANVCELLHADVKQWLNADFKTAPDDEDIAPSINDLVCVHIYDNLCKKIDSIILLNCQ